MFSLYRFPTGRGSVLSCLLYSGNLLSELSSCSPRMSRFQKRESSFSQTIRIFIVVKLCYSTVQFFSSGLNASLGFWTLFHPSFLPSFSSPLPSYPPLSHFSFLPSFPPSFLPSLPGIHMLSEKAGGLSKLTARLAGPPRR